MRRLSLSLDNHNGEEAKIGRAPLSHCGEKIKTQLTGTKLNRIVHGDRDCREQRAPKLLLSHPR
jgi:hypothetical protein